MTAGADLVLNQIPRIGHRQSLPTCDDLAATDHEACKFSRTQFCETPTDVVPSRESQSVRRGIAHRSAGRRHVSTRLDHRLAEALLPQFGKFRHE